MGRDEAKGHVCIVHKQIPHFIIIDAAPDTSTSERSFTAADQEGQDKFQTQNNGSFQYDSCLVTK